MHGNLPALVAVLRDVREAEVDIVVAGGDVLPGPMPRETLARLFDLRVPTTFIIGNGELPFSKKWRAKSQLACPRSTGM